MSTFDGIIAEFPTIRVDNFRYRPDKAPPQACFLSHVHSDHLHGLETLKMPFVYCSAATKRILLRMEKYSHRMNLAKGILEVRKQTFKSLRLVLRELPLESPVEIELDPKTKIRVTLFDANHCPGAVMFLFENLEKGVLYTGDVRAEPWWVNSLIAKPILLPYSCGAKSLDCIYLDTTFASRNRMYEEFPSKADGLKELLTKVAKCAKDSRFYFRSWTLGYEDVWIALSSFLQSPVHVDAYQLRIFKSLTNEMYQVDRGSVLAGFSFGNQYQPGCLTDNTRASIHSCEPGTECHINLKTEPNVVWIFPIVSRTKDGTELEEIGAGSGDLHETALLEMMDETSIQNFEELFSGDDRYKDVLKQLRRAFELAGAQGAPSISIKGVDLDQDQEVSIKEFVNLILRQDEDNTPDEPLRSSDKKVIHFPYSRHSSFSELRHLVSCFRPKDICPCTVDVDAWSDEVSMRSLFGDICSSDDFQHDRQIALMVRNREESRGKKRKRTGTQDRDISTDNDFVNDDRNTKQASESTAQTYTSAQTCAPKHTTTEREVIQGSVGSLEPIQPLDHGVVDEELEGQKQQQTTHDTITSSDLPTPIRRFHRTLSNRFDQELESQKSGNGGDGINNNSIPDEEISIGHPTTATSTGVDRGTGTGTREFDQCPATITATAFAVAAPVPAGATVHPSTATATATASTPSPLSTYETAQDHDPKSFHENSHTSYNEGNDNDTATATATSISNYNSLPSSGMNSNPNPDHSPHDSMSDFYDAIDSDDNGDSNSDGESIEDDSRRSENSAHRAPHLPRHRHRNDNDKSQTSPKSPTSPKSVEKRQRTKTTTRQIKRRRRECRIKAYRAASLALTDNLIDEWCDLGLRSVGWKGHTEVETEL